MKEITPFLYTSLYSYGCLENFEQLYTKFGTCMLTHENKQKWSSTVNIVDDIVNDKAKVIETPVEEIIVKPEEDRSASELCSYAERDDAENVVKASPVHVIVPVIEPLIPVMPLPRRFSPKKPDSLFWSMFVAHYGVDTFLQIGSKYMNREIEEKTHTMEFLGKNRSLQKSLKISAASGQEIMGDLMTNKQTTLAMLPAFAMYYKKTIWVVSETSRTYHVFRGHDISDEDVYVIYRNKNERGQKTSSLPQYAAETVVTPEILENIRTQYLPLDSIMKPLKGPGNFKMGDLEQMMEKLGIQLEEGVKMKKGEMYETILKHCVIAWI